MRLKQSKNKPLRKNYFLLAISTIIFLLITISFLKTLILSKNNIPSFTNQQQLLEQNKNLTKHLKIEIKNKDFQKLAQKRQEALQKGILLTSSKDYVPAKIHAEEKTVNAKIRLKGDWSDHWGDESKWSFRIEIENNETLFGMTNFAIQKPETRGFLSEWVFHKMLKSLELPYIRYDFINVSVNNNYLGIYALEEHFEKRLVENSKNREGPIVKFDDSLLWLYRAEQPTTYYQESYSYGQIQPFEEKSTLKDPIQSKYFQQAVNLLEKFRRNELKTSQVFDSQKLSQLIAVTNLAGNSHALYFHNMRFYYNPITSLLEPIGFDNGPFRQIEPSIPFITENQKSTSFQPIPSRDIDFEQSFFQDQNFFKDYTQALVAISQPQWLDNFFQEYQTEIDEKIQLLQTEYPDYDFELDKNILYQNQKLISNMLSPEQSIISHFQSINLNNNSIELAVSNIQKFPVEITEIQLENKPLYHPQNLILPPKQYLSPLEFQKIQIPLPSNYPWSEKSKKNLEIKYHTLGLETTLTTKVTPWPYLEETFLETDLLRQPPNPHEFDFIKTNPESKVITITSGTLNKTLILPADYQVAISPGSIINLENSANIISYSPIAFKGSKDLPITIESQNKTGQGIFVLNTKQNPSTINHTIFKNLSAPKQGNWELVSAINFYESKVSIENSHFLENHSADDMLNIIRSEFKITNSLFENTFADAIDIDFGKGDIINSSFINCGAQDGNGDCLDFSGSSINLENLTISKAKDKAISAGEKSTIQANTIKITNANIGIASKDSSTVNTTNLEINNANYGLAAYQKKPEFGPAEIKVTNPDFQNIKNEYLNETNSQITISKTPKEPNTENALKILYPNE